MVTRISVETVERCAAAWPDVVASVAGGSDVETATAEHGLTPNALWAFRAGRPELLQEWTQARLASADSFADEALRTARNSKLDPSHARVLVDTLKWAAAKRNPDHYADRSRHDINVKAIDYTQVLERAERRLAAQAAARIVEGEVLHVALAATEQSSETND